MTKKALLVRLETKHGQDEALQNFLRSAVPLVQQEPATMSWFAIRFGRGQYGIFDTFPDDAGRDAHINGEVAALLRQRGPDMLDKRAEVTMIDVLAEKVPATIPDGVTKALLLTLKCKAGHESEVEQFLIDARKFVMEEEKTVAWYALRLGDGMYGIFDVFPDNSGRFAHLTGHVPRELAKHALTILGGIPDIEMLDIVANKPTT